MKSFFGHIFLSYKIMLMENIEKIREEKNSLKPILLMFYRIFFYVGMYIYLTYQE